MSADFMEHPRVAVTGLGLLTALGLDLETSWQGLLAARTPFKRFSLFDPEGLASPFGAELPEGAAELFKQHVKLRRRRQMTRGTMMTVVAAHMALDDSGVDRKTVPAERIGVVMGATGTGYAPRTTDTDEHRILRNMASAPAAWVSIQEKAGGPSFVVSTACSSGAYAFHAAIGLIQSGQCDVVLAGAGDSALTYLDVQGFCSLMALSEDAHCPERASRPFSRDRNGFVMGEGAGVLVLESLEHARARAARVYAELSPPGLCAETYNIVSPEPDGRGMARAMGLALQNAGLDPSAVDYVNAHGTSTPLNDVYETKAIKSVFGDRAKQLPVSATKSMTGHCLSAAAGVEAVICCKALAENTIPPTANLTDPDPECDLDYVPGAPRQQQLNSVMCNSFGFGGHNGVCIFTRPGVH
ncbi:MAG: beta-ketoacyl-ACP synthase II [Chitinivibrionales bacterium]|nr:beta-ketoacyl-ACP synthase II [Chitinivibrionales bacterium]